MSFFKKFGNPSKVDPDQSIICTQEELDLLREESERRRKEKEADELRRRLNDVTAARTGHAEEV